MKRRTWLIASVVALFGLQVPLCALACLHSQETKAAIADTATQPCHEHASDSSPADSPTSKSGTDCCEFAYDAVVSDVTTQLDFVSLGVAQQTAHFWLTPEAGGHRLTAATSASLPPPNILLLKSTLII